MLELSLGGDEAVYIKADSEGKPLAGAQPVKVSALFKAADPDGRATWSTPHEQWAEGGLQNIWTNLTMLGAPIAEATESPAEDGSTTVTQEFEGGRIIWKKGTTELRAELNDLGKEKNQWYDSLRIQVQKYPGV
ncbi:MAG: hypothetical protein Q3965_06230 [Rothia sp. (in: high G+C Gram-positive bacteria)]|nr:hypothetical protein [Rothia sp. (in: high G+C Gram-positive bacteria)]